MTRAKKGRLLARLELAIGLGAAIAVAVWFVAAPGQFGPMFGPGRSVEIPTQLGFLGILVGLAWMVRLYRAEPESDQHAWRYRQRD